MTVRSALTAALAAGVLFAGPALAAGEKGVSIAEKLGNATAFEDAPSTYLHCFAVMSAIESLSDTVSGLEDTVVQTAFDVSKATLQAWSTQAERFSEFYGDRLKSLDPAIPQAEQVAYAGSVAAFIKQDIKAFIHAKDRRACIDYANRMEQGL